MGAYRIADPHTGESEAIAEQEKETYLVVADPLEQEINVDVDYDAILCTGDMLDLAPPPGTDSIDGSLIAEYGDDAEELYEAGNAPGILSAVSDITKRDAVVAEATARYRDFFDSIDAPFYYTAGNQDIPEALDAAADDYDGVQHVDELDAFTGIDGMVPGFAGVPSGCFPVEKTEQEFYDAVQDADGDVLVAHSIGDEDAESLDVDRVVSSKPDRGTRHVTHDTAKLAPYPDDYLLLTL